MNNGDRVKWRYQHCLGRAYTTITKKGTFIKEQKNGYALVQFEGNKNPSRVLAKSLRVMQ